MAINAFGTQFLMGDGATPEVFAAVAELTDISGPSFSKDTIETTNHGSTDGFREYISGLKDGGEVNLTLNFLPQGATHGYDSGLLSQLVDDEVHNYKIILTDEDATTITFSAIVTSFDIAEPIDDKLSAEVTLKLTGVPDVEVSGSA